MDKQEQRELIGEIKKAYARGDFDRVLEYAGEMNLRKLGDNRTLEMVADAHAANGQLEDARDVLLMAYEKTPMGRKMAYKLSELSIALDNLDDAVEFYEDFCKMAPHDNDRYLLKYKIGKAGGVAAEDLAKVLAVYCSKEVDEKWMYELASLYYKLREKEKCLEICDNIILWFANGDYVRKAESLKMKLGENVTQAAPKEKEPAAAGVIGQDIPVEGFIEISSPQEKDELSDDYSMEDLGDAFLQEALDDDIPDQNMAIGDAIALAEAKEQAEFVNAAENFEVFRETPAPAKKEPVIREIVPVVRKYEQLDESISFDAETEPEGNQYEVNGEVITLPKTTFEDMSHDWTIPEELLNAEDVSPSAEEFEEPVYGAHRYVPPTEQKSEFEEPVYGSHRVVTKAEEEAAKAALAKELEEAEKNLELEEVAQGEIPVVPVAPAEAAVETAPAAPAEATVEAAPAAPVAEAAATVIPEAPATEPAAPAPAAVPEEAPAVPAPEEEMLQASDNPIIAAVIEPVREEEPDELQSWNHFDSVFPPAFNDTQDERPRLAPDVVLEPKAASGEKSAEERPDSEGPILFAIAPQEDEAAPDTLVLPESVDADTVIKNREDIPAAPAAAPETPAEPAVKAPEMPKQEKVPLSFTVTPEPAKEKPVQTEVIRPMGNSKYSSVNTLFAEDEADNIDGQITLDSMFATYSRREVKEEPVIPETKAMPVEEFAAEPEELITPVPQAAEAEDDGEPPLITDLAGSFGELDEETPAYEEKPYTQTSFIPPVYEEPVSEEPVYEEPVYEEPLSEEPADGDMSDFEKAMQAYDAARAEGKEGFDFKALLTKSIEGEQSEEIFVEPESEEFVEERYDEEPEEFEEEYEDEYEEFDEYDEEYDEGGSNGESYRFSDDYEVGFGDDYEEEYEEEYEDEEAYEEEDGFNEEYDEYEAEPEEFEEEFEEEYEEEYDGYDDSEEVGEEEPYGEEFDEYSEEYDESYEESYDEESGYEEDAEYSDESYEEEDTYEEEPYEEEPYEEAESGAYYGYEMPEDLREELSEFLLIDGMEERITDAIDSLIEKKRQGDPTGGNLIVTGDTKSGKTYLTIAVIKAVGREIGGNSRVAKVNAQALNGKNMSKVFEKIAGSDLLIENVGYMSDETVENLIRILRTENLSSMVALEGNQLAIDNMLNKHPVLQDLFQTRLSVKELNLTQWADLACEYAEQQGYTVSDMALLALHAKIDELNIPTARLGYEDIKGIIDNAIANASKRGGGKFRFGSKKHKGNAKQLDEADFM
ncbi:MAG: hypothetical protein IKZ95_07255 [Lachnospiraceae bacterium]|nr:hypothetical protein [Lachnospiraceae bacterium]